MSLLLLLPSPLCRAGDGVVVPHVHTRTRTRARTHTQTHTCQRQEYGTGFRPTVGHQLRRIPTNSWAPFQLVPGLARGGEEARHSVPIIQQNPTKSFVYNEIPTQNDRHSLLPACQPLAPLPIPSHPSHASHTLRRSNQRRRRCKVKGERQSARERERERGRERERERENKLGSSRRGKKLQRHDIPEKTGRRRHRRRRRLGVSSLHPLNPCLSAACRTRWALPR
jgi:hypothetical protein